MNGLQVFSNEEFSLDIAPDEIDGFRVQAPSLARALSVADAYTLLRSIPEDEKGYALVRTPGGEQRVSYVTEAGFYRAIGQRQTGRIQDREIRNQVERFQNWVYREVLPQIRRTGSYSAAPAMPDITTPEGVLAMAEQFAATARQLVAANQKVAELEPPARSWNALAAATGDFLVADAAKILSRDPHITIGQNQLYSLLASLGWVYRAASDGRWRARQNIVNSGRLAEKPMSHYHPRTGEEVIDPPQIRVTVKGIGWLHDHLGGGRRLELPQAG